MYVKIIYSTSTTKRTKISVTDLLKHVAIKVAKCVVVRACKALFLDCTSIAKELRFGYIFPLTYLTHVTCF